MKCYVHNDREAVAKCSICGRGLCSECSDKYEDMLCEKCAPKVLEATKEDLKETLKASAKSAKRWRVFAILAIIEGCLVGLIPLENGFNSGTVAGFFSGIFTSILGIVICVYCFLGLVMGLRRALHSNARSLLDIWFVGWFIFLWVIIVKGAIYCIPEFISLNREIKDAKHADEIADEVTLN